MAAPATPQGLTMRHLIMQRSADASAPAVPTGLRLSGNTLTWDASADPYSAPTGASGLKEYVLTRDGAFLATVATTPGLSLEITGQDIGAMSPPGSDTQAGASHSMTAAGERIYSTADQFRYKYGTVTGNCTIIARITAFAPNAAGYAKASLMFRESTAVGSACAHLMQYSNVSNSGTKIEYRTATNASMLDGTTVAAGTLPQWLKFTRVGNVFTGYYSYDGNTWVSNGAVSVSLPATALVGLALCSEVVGTPVTATFTDVVITNSPAQSYVDATLVGTPVYRVAARDIAGNLSAYGAPASTAAVGGATEIPAQNTQTPTKYVSPSGTLGGFSAYTTLQAAFDEAVPGDVIAVGPGTYAQRAVLTTSGTLAQPIYVRCFDYNDRPTFDGQYSRSIVPGWDPQVGGTGVVSLFTVYASNVTVDGLNFIRSPEGGILLGIGNTNGSFIFPGDYGTFYSNIKLIRCSMIGGETLLLTLNVDGCDIYGCTFLDGQRAYYSPTGNPPTRTWGQACMVMGKNIKFIENVVGQSSGEGLHAGYHGSFAGTDGLAHIQVANITIRNNVFFDHWSTPLYLTNVDGGVIERNLCYYTNDLRYWEGRAYPHAAITIGSESGRGQANNGELGTNLFAGMRDVIIRNNVATGGLYLIRFTDEPNIQTTRVKILNNTFFRTVGGTASSVASALSNIEPQLSDITFQNNLTYDAVPAQMCREWQTPSGTWTRSNNLFSTSPPVSLSGVGDVLTTSPGLTNANYAPSGAYPIVVPFDTNAIRLQAGSPAIGAGVPLADVTDDYFGNARPLGSNDIGAHSYTP